MTVVAKLKKGSGSHIMKEKVELRSQRQQLPA